VQLHGLLLTCATVTCIACSPGRVGGSSDTSTDDGGHTSTTTADDTGTSSSSTGTSSTESTGDESSTETGEEPDACPVDPELGGYQVLLDDKDWAIDYQTLDGSLAWTHACTVTSHTGALASGETIGLDCVDGEGQAVEHTLELLAEVDGAPLEAPVLVGQQVELALWLRVWFSGTVAWTLRDADQNLLLLHYNGPNWPEPWAVEGEYAPPLEHIAPLTIGVNMDVCPLECPEEETTGTFVPSDGCCQKDTALRLDLGDGPVQIQQRSGGTIPGPAGAYAIVDTSRYVDVNSCTVSDINPEYYRFTIVSGG
jgi:hypothetical protein